MVDYYKNHLYVPTEIKKLSENEAALALRDAWQRYYNNLPNNRQLALLWAQSALETGRWKIIRNNNFGNIKKKHAKPNWNIKDDGHLFTMFATGENLWNQKLGKSEYHWFEPPDPQTHFRAYRTATDGAEDYIKFVSQRKRYVKAWQMVLAGDPEGFSHELKVAGYYTASEALYTKGIVRLTNEFLRKAESLLAWKPEILPEPEELEELFTEGEKQEIMDQLGISVKMSIDEYFANTNNKTIESDEEEQFHKMELNWWDKIQKRVWGW